MFGLVLESLECSDQQPPLRGNYSCSEKHSHYGRESQASIRQIHLADRKTWPDPKGITALTQGSAGRRGNQNS